MPVTNDAKRPINQPVVFTASSNSNAFNLKGYALASVIITSALVGATLTVQRQFNGVWVPVRNRLGVAMTITLNGIGEYQFAGEPLLGMENVRLVSSAAETTTEAGGQVTINAIPVV